MANLHLTDQDFQALGLEMVGFLPHRQARVCAKTNMDRFLSSYGIVPAACSAVFDDLQTTAVDRARLDNPDPFHFLVTLNWMKTYKLEHEMAGFFDVYEKTARTIIWVYVKAIRALKAEKIVWSDYDGFEIPYSVDGVHCRTNDVRRYPDSHWCSYKLNKPGLAYEIVLALYEDQVVSIRGPFKGGVKDLAIFNGEAQPVASDFDLYDDEEEEDQDEPTIDKIPDGKMAFGDKGYQGAGPKVSLYNEFDSEDVKEMKRRAGARQESFNKRIKTFKVLDERFRHGFRKHKVVFEAACVLAQYDMENGRPLFAL